MTGDSVLDLLEFQKLLNLVAGHVHSEATRRAVLGLRPLDSKEAIERRFGLVGEIRSLASQDTPLPISHFADSAPLLRKLRPEGAVLEGFEAAAFTPLFTIEFEIASQLAERRDLKLLNDLAGHLTGFPDILRVLVRSLDGDGHILDTASAALAGVRADIRRLEARIRRRLEEMVRDSRVSVFLQDTFITQRSGRWVIPVRMDSKGQVPGVVHDVSKSGETAFIEPLSIINLANELENLIAEEKAEEIRILRNITSLIRAAADDIEAEYDTVVQLDGLNAVAEFAAVLNMATPVITDSLTVKLVKARHPLLALTLQRSERVRGVVPLDVELGGDQTVMVITGSNAGGKTIAIKTIGLLTVMALSGIPVPADSSSVFPLIKYVLIDIGDEQSIESSLSTFSAHVSHIAHILEHADDRTLVLLDELGTGTDPEEGAALACAVLQDIREKGSLLFATTHLTDIKGFVHRTEGMLNASMEFDHVRHEPLYRLRVGEPGQSHALDVAARYGLPERIIRRARELLGSQRIEFDRLIAELNEKRADYERGMALLELQRKDLEERDMQLRRMVSEAERKHRETLAGAYHEADSIVSATRRQMNALFDEMKRSERARRRDLIAEAERQQHALREKISEYGGEETRTPSIDEIMEGDVVFVRSLGHDAPVAEVDLRHSRVRVISGDKEVEVPLTDLGYRRGKAAPVSTESKTPKSEGDRVETKIHLVGLRVDEAISRLEPFLNHAALAGVGEVVIIHGIGKGILMRAVRDHLKGHPLVREFRSGTPQEGGAGVTVTSLK